MKKLLTGIVVGLVIGTAATATATTSRDVYLNQGDRAYPSGGETTCTVQPHGGSRNGFVCKVGGDYRAKFGVIVNEREVAITQYTSFGRYRIVVRKEQVSPDAADASCGSYPPQRPDLVNIRAIGMPCWAAKHLLDKAVTSRVAPKGLVVVVGFTCRFVRRDEGSGSLSCVRGADSARATFSVF